MLILNLFLDDSELSYRTLILVLNHKTGLTEMPRNVSVLALNTPMFLSSSVFLL